MLLLRINIVVIDYNIRLYIIEVLVVGDVYCCVYVVSIIVCDLGKKNIFFYNMKIENNVMILVLDIFCILVFFWY